MPDHHSIDQWSILLEDVSIKLPADDVPGNAAPISPDLYRQILNLPGDGNHACKEIRVGVSDVERSISAWAMSRQKDAVWINIEPLASISESSEGGQNIVFWDLNQKKILSTLNDAHSGKQISCI